MSLACGCDSEEFIEVPLGMITSPGTEFCRECGRLIPFGEKHYRVRCWTIDEYENERGVFPVCEACGDLAATFLELGFCWYFGDLREDVKELSEEG